MSFEQVPRNARSGGIKPLYLYAGAGVLVVGAVLWTKRRAAAPVAGADVLPPDSALYDPQATDPNAYGDYSPIVGTTPGVYPGVTVGSVAAPVNNAQWAQQAIAQLDNQGFDTVQATIALGVYLAGGALSSTQLQMVQAAIAVAGYPPTPVPAAHTVPPTGQTTTLKAGPRLTVVLSRTTATLNWTAVPDATHYHLRHVTGAVVGNYAGLSHTVARHPYYTFYIVSAYQGSKLISKDSNVVQVH